MLLTNSLGLLPMWNDELFTVRAARQPVAAMLEMVRGDVHPPLYFLLAHYWIQIAPSGETLVQLRLLSVVFALLATIALDRLWLKNVPAAPAPVVSAAVDLVGVPAVVLPHGAILQLAGFGIRRGVLGGVAMEPGVRFLEADADMGRSLAALLYTHYVPGSRRGPARTCCCCGKCVSGRPAGWPETRSCWRPTCPGS